MSEGLLIEARGLVRRYHRGGETLEVLRDLDISVGRGEFLALMGPSGSGKSTLLHLLGGLDSPDEGSIRVEGEEISRLSRDQLSAWRARGVGFIFQTFNLIPVLTALENVALPLLLTRLSRRERQERARFALELVGLGDRTGHLPGQLSGGQEQRVAIARAIVTDPLFLLADEPTGDLDRASADAVLDLLGRLQREQKKTIIMVTHDPQAAARATRLLHLDKGRLLEKERAVTPSGRHDAPPAEGSA